MKSLLMLVLVGVLLCLGGCTTLGTGPAAVDNQRFPPDSLLQDCVADAPPNKYEYMAADYPPEKRMEVRERLLIAFSTAQTANLAKCNVDKKQLREWKKQQEGITK